MKTIRERAKDQLPMVLLTLLSIVQALALELLWGYVSDESYLYQPTWEALLGWIQILATLLGILLIWLIYGSTVMRFRWVPSTADSIFPFIVGIFEFTLIALLGPARLGVWFLMMGLIYALMTGVSQLAYVAARRDPENDEFFGTMGPASWRDFIPAMWSVGLMLLTGGLLIITGHTGGFALVALLGVITALAYQMYRTDYFWRLSVGGR